MPVLDLSPNELLTTIRSVRRRLDFSRPVEPEVIMQRLEIALQAPTGGNSAGLQGDKRYSEHGGVSLTPSAFQPGY